LRLFRKVVDSSSLFLARIKKKQRIALQAKPEDTIKLNLGCGLAVAPGWINIDGSLNALIATLPCFLHKLAYQLTGANRYYEKSEYLSLLSDNRFIHHGLNYGLPLEDSVADFLYTSHFVEHLFRADAKHLLDESYRVLKPQGVIRITIPDLEYAISLYEKGDKEKMLTAYFFVEDDESYYARHKYMYDYEMISELLRNAGFKNIKRCKYQQGDTPDISILDNRPDESLFVEATR